MIEVDLKLSSLGFTTKRNIKSTWMIFFAALVGSIFGVMQSFGALMSFTEKYLEKLKKKRVEKINIETVKKARKALFDSFDRPYKIKRNIKRFRSSSIMPTFELKII